MTNWDLFSMQGWYSMKELTDNSVVIAGGRGKGGRCGSGGGYRENKQ